MNFSDPLGLNPCSWVCSWFKTLAAWHQAQEARVNAEFAKLGGKPKEGMGIVGGLIGGPEEAEAEAPAYLGRAARKVQGLLMHVTRSDLSGAAKDLEGIASGGQHLKEVAEAASGLRKMVRSLNGFMSDPTLEPESVRAAQRLLGVASKALDRAERVIGG